MTNDSFPPDTSFATAESNPEYRRDPVLGRWVILAPERSRRPLGLASSKPHPRPDAERDTCPFCEGREDQSPPEVFAYRTPGSVADGPGWTVRVVPNKFPAVREEVDGSVRDDGLFQSRPGFGFHEVVIECPRHESNPARLSASELQSVFTAYRERLRMLSADPRVAAVSVFKNVGAEAGASLAHSHSQVIALPLVPETMQAEFDAAHTFHAREGRCVYCAMLEREIAAGVRVVAETERFVAIAPYASRFAYEMSVFPKAHHSHYESLTDAAAGELAGLVRSLLGKLDVLLAYPAYNYYLHTGPVRTDPLAAFHWHLELFPRTARVAGFEWASGCFINAVPPEWAAAELRAAVPASPAEPFEP